MEAPRLRRSTGSCNTDTPDLLAQGGLGRIQTLYPGPTDTTVLPANANMADPDGSTSNTFFTTFAGVLNEAGD